MIIKLKQIDHEDMKVRAAKKITRAVVGASTYWTVKNIIENNTDPENRKQQAEAKIGGMVAGTMATEATKPWIDNKFDDLVNNWNTFIQTIGIKQDNN